MQPTRLGALLPRGLSEIARPSIANCPGVAPVALVCAAARPRSCDRLLLSGAAFASFGEWEKSAFLLNLGLNQRCGAASLCSWAALDEGLGFA